MADGTAGGATMGLTLRIWRQAGPGERGALVDYPLDGVSPDMSFLETLDLLNERLVGEGGDPVAFDHDCREGICGACSLMIDGRAHGPERETTACQLHMRSFGDGDLVVVEPWRARAFPVVKDLMVDRSALDRIIEAGGFVSVGTGGAPEARAVPVPKEDAESAMDAASCIGCGACVAACKNASAMLFAAAKISQLALLPQGALESGSRVLSMTRRMDEEGFGACTNEAECEASCPKGISVSHIARMNRLRLKAALGGGGGGGGGGGP